MPKKIGIFFCIVEREYLLQEGRKIRISEQNAKRKREFFFGFQKCNHPSFVFGTHGKLAATILLVVKTVFFQ